MNKEKFVAAIIEEINGFNSNEIVDLNNIYCDENGYDDSRLYSNDEDFFEMSFGNKVMDAVRAVTYGEYNYTHDWVKFNGYGNLESMNYVGVDDLPESVETIAEYVAENFRDFDHLFSVDESDFEEDEDEEDDDDEVPDEDDAANEEPSAQ